MSSYLADLRRRTREAREARQAATLGDCPGCRQCLVIVRADGELRCRRCEAPLLIVADKEAPRRVVFRALTAGSKARPTERRPFEFRDLGAQGNGK